MQSLKIKGRSVALRYESLTEMYEHAESGVRNPNAATSMADWYGSSSFAEALQVATTGWKDGPRPNVEKMAAQMGDLIAPMVKTDLVTEHRPWGGAVNIDRYLMGEPDCMVTPILAPTLANGRVVKVLANTGARATITPQQYIARGVSLLVLAEMLRLAGLSMELWLETSNDRGHTMIVKALAAGDPIDIDALMFPLAHPSFHRRMVFAIREKTVGVGGSINCCAVDEIDPDVKVESVLRPQLPIVKDPAGWVLGELSRLGLTLD